jgi:hypothetical protein
MKLPILHEQYYTIEDSFALLNKCGADLFKAEDILSLGRKGAISIGLLCDETIYIIKKDLVDNQLAELIQNDLADVNKQPKHTEKPVGELGLCCDWLALSEIKPKPLERLLGGKRTSKEFYTINSRELLIVQLLQAPDAHIGNMYATAWLEPSTKETLRFPATLLIGNEKYYVCDDGNANPFSCLFDKQQLPFNGNYGTRVFERLIQKGNYVLTKETIHEYLNESASTPTKLLKPDDDEHPFNKRKTIWQRWLYETWVKESRPTAAQFYRILCKNYIQTENSPILKKHTNPKRVFYYKTEGMVKEKPCAPKTLSNHVSKFKSHERDKNTCQD